MISTSSLKGRAILTSSLSCYYLCLCTVWSYTFSIILPFSIVRTIFVNTIRTILAWNLSTWTILTCSLSSYYLCLFTFWTYTFSIIWPLSIIRTIRFGSTFCSIFIWLLVTWAILTRSIFYHNLPWSITCTIFTICPIWRSKLPFRALFTMSHYHYL